MLLAVCAALMCAASEAVPPPATPELEARVAELERQMDDLGTLAGPPAVGPNIFNPSITVFGNGLLRYDDRRLGEEDERRDRHFNVREVEIDLRAPVDPFADGVLIAAFESELPGVFEAAIEEGFVTIKRLPLPLLEEPPLGLKLKVGRFRAETGRVNRLHLHDLPQVSRPLVIEEFYGEEGFVANGLSAQVFLPTYSDDAALELTAQVLSGGGAPVADGPPQSPGLVANLRWFHAFAGHHNVDLSFIVHHGQTGARARNSAQTYSADALYKWKPRRGGEFRSFVLGGQVLYAHRRFREGTDTDSDGAADAFTRRTTTPLGYFAFAQWQAARTVYLGARWDDTATLVDDLARRQAVSAFLSWYVSEFLRFRVGGERRISDVPEEDGQTSAFAELNFVFGAHPPEPFWVNR